MMHADHMKEGVVYGFQPVGTYVSPHLAETGHVYCFRRSVRATLKSANTAMERTNAVRTSHSGLNRTGALVHWKLTHDVEGTWDALKERLRWQGRYSSHAPQRAGGITPRWITQLYELGDNWFCTDLGAETFTQWLSAPVEYKAPSTVELQQISARVQVAGDELVIGPVSSEFAALAVLGRATGKRKPRGPGAPRGVLVSTNPHVREG